MIAKTHQDEPGAGGTGVGGSDPTSAGHREYGLRAVERWLDELERFANVLASQEDYLDAVEAGTDADLVPPRFVGATDLPPLPAPLEWYARQLIDRHAALVERASALAQRIRPRFTPRPQPGSGLTRGNAFEQQA